MTTPIIVSHIHKYPSLVQLLSLPNPNPTIIVVALDRLFSQSALLSTSTTVLGFWPPTISRTRSPQNRRFESFLEIINLKSTLFSQITKKCRSANWPPTISNPKSRMRTLWKV
ncbi:hypothetical protein L6452_19608 [Arctium lappa]|uniref:Uncharacterized protein n=1 Tax=Arctium lappa TaxID=4217 RepID=A0ACB9BAB7_ARCLA|nr:hypothetical protein L6452_19608 [Arctium lappa]